MHKPVLNWSPARPIRAKDNIISSSAREKNLTGFNPSYETEPKQYMNFIMSNEYMKIWFKERRQYEKDIYSREETIKEESKIKRRVVQRMMTYRRPLKNDFIDDCVQKKKGNQPILNQIVNPEKMKYRPDCQKKGGKLSKSKAQNNDKTGGPQSKSPNASEAKAQDKDKQQKSGKANKEYKESKGKTRRGAEEDDEFDVAEEVLLVCADTANVENECCECEDNK